MINMQELKVQINHGGLCLSIGSIGVLKIDISESLGVFYSSPLLFLLKHAYNLGIYINILNPSGLLTLGACFMKIAGIAPLDRLECVLSRTQHEKWKKMVTTFFNVILFSY